MLANIGKGVMVTPHGIYVDAQGNVWIADFAGNKEGTKGHQVHKFSPKGDKLLSLGMAGKPGNGDGQFNQPNDVVVGPDGSIYAFTSQLAKDLPLGIHADTVQVTDEGMAAHFSTHRASIGPGDSGQDGTGQGAPCIRRRVGR